VQVNDREAGLLWRGDYAPMPAATEAALAERVAALGVEGLLVTRGPRGASWLPATGEPVHVPAHSPKAAVDPTGCGDVLGAAWFALRAGRGMDPAAALAGAIRAAGLAAATRGTAALYSTLMAEGGPTP
jgi:D-beta-D-heptose 7-phosphate kinase/D-beta-D-heptose 1-phosphate adenosyltransferase